MTAVTISSLIPSVSIFDTEVVSPGEGGGVCSYALPRLLGRSTAFAVVEEAETSDGEIGDSESLVCERLIFFEGGDCWSAGCLDGGER